jgi:hypothetical protein
LLPHGLPFDERECAFASREEYGPSGKEATIWCGYA